MQFEWLATGRGTTALTRNEELECVATAHAVLVDDPAEMRMVVAMRAATSHARMALVEMAEELAASRVGRKPKQS